MYTKYFLVTIVSFFISMSSLISEEIQRTDSLPISEATIQTEKAELEKLIKSIAQRVSYIESIHQKLVRFDDSYDKEVLLRHSTLPDSEEERAKQLITKRITKLRFDGGRLREIELNFKQNYLNISWEFENKKLIYQPSDYQKTVIYTEGVEHNYVTDMEYFSLQNKVKVLRKVEQNLIESSYKLENILHGYETKKSKKEKKQMELY